MRRSDTADSAKDPQKDSLKGSASDTEKSTGKSAEKSTPKGSTSRKARESAKDSAKDPRKSGNPAKAAAAREAQEESRAAANRVSRTPQKVKDISSPAWYAPLMVTIMVIGLLWVVTTYLFRGQFPIPWFATQTGWIVNGNLYIGFLIMMLGMLGIMRWR